MTHIDRPGIRGAVRYYPALDGVRALAVLAVMGYHASPLVPGGFFGVDVFFVLSGFLITTLLLDEKRRTQTIDVVAFWGRRARRLLPALFVALLLVAAYATFASLAPERGQIRGDAVASLFYVSNWRFIFQHASYFAAGGPPSPLRHTWSLAIEEQYYLVWPLIVGFTLRRFDRRRLLWGCVCLAAGSALLAVLLYTPYTDPSRVYYGTDTRVQALAIGSALGALMTTRAAGYATRRVRDISGWLGLAGLALITFVVHDSNIHVYQGGLTGVAVLSALLVLGATGDDRTPLTRTLSVRPLRWIGLISYGLYIYHWPVYVWLTPERTHHHGVVLLALRFAVTFAIAVASFYLIERPVRARRLPGTRGFGIRPAVLLGGTASVVAVAVFASTAGAISWTDYYSAPTFGRRQAPPNAPRILAVGDSTSVSLTAAIDPVVQSEANWSTSQRLGCGFLLTGIDVAGRRDTKRASCAGVEEQWRERIAKVNPDLVVMIAGPEEVLNHFVNGRAVKPGSPEFDASLRDAVETAVDIFSKRGARVVFTDIPCFHPTIGDGVKERNDPSRSIAVNKVLYAVAAQDPRVHILNWSDFLCPGGRFVAQKDGAVMRPDGIHFRYPGTHVVWQWLGPQIIPLARAAQVARKLGAPVRASTTATTVPTSTG